MWLFYSSDADVYSQAASNLVSSNNLDMGGGTVVRALVQACRPPGVRCSTGEARITPLVLIVHYLFI